MLRMGIEKPQTSNLKTTNEFLPSGKTWRIDHGKLKSMSGNNFDDGRQPEMAIIRIKTGKQNFVCYSKV